MKAHREVLDAPREPTKPFEATKRLVSSRCASTVFSVEETLNPQLLGLNLKTQPSTLNAQGSTLGGDICSALPIERLLRASEPSSGSNSGGNPREALLKEMKEMKERDTESSTPFRVRTKRVRFGDLRSEPKC
jgi:hypothetical protein